MVRGVPKLTGAPVMATDLRASVSLVLAGLGLAPTMFLLIVGASAASRYVNWRHSILLGLFLAGCSALLFTKLLALPLQAFGPWIPFIGDFF